MLREFYDFIAKKIYSYFQTASSEGVLLKGESFCLKLDDEDMVSEVTNALKEWSVMHQAIGEYQYVCRDGSLYKTFTIRLANGEEVIIASQINGMTNDFLCATLRNAANDAEKPLLMISASPIDSAKSGSRDMTASGMPFHAEQIMSEVRKMVTGSTQLSNVEKRILEFELKRRDADVFSDKASLYEYRDLLSIMSTGKIDTNNFPGFRLFAVDGKTEYQNYGNTQIDREIKNNYELFEKIDRGIRFGNLEFELSKVFEENVILRIEKAYKEDAENWSRLFTYAELLAAIEKKQAKTENPLKIDNEDICVYGDMPINALVMDGRCLIRNEGSQTAKKRTKNIFVFNSDRYPVIHIAVNCNTKVANSSIMKDDSEYERDGKSLIFAFEREGLTFHKIELHDEANGIKYIFKICIADILPEYLLSTIKHSFSIEYKSNKKNTKIKLAGIGTNLIFNKNAEEVTSFKLQDNEVYSCSYGKRLLLTSTEEELAVYGSGIKIEIDFAGLVVPFVLYPDESKSEEIIGRKILRDKMSTKRSFEFEDGAILSESQEYFAKTNLLRELRAEQEIIEKSILQGYCEDFYSTDKVTIQNIDILLPENLKQAYIDMLSEFRAAKTIPTLAYLDGVIRETVERFLVAFDSCYEDLNDGDNLSKEQENALLLGTITIGRDNEEILLTPFHPLNLRYQLQLSCESGFEYASNVVVDRLNSINLLPYIQRNRRVYKISDQLFSQEWKYYAPVENKKYRGSRRYVPKLVEEKITEFISHFRYIFDEINNKTIRINLINMGDCADVFVGLSQYFIHSINRNADVEKLIRFELHIYTENTVENVFTKIKEYTILRDYLAELRLSVENGTSMNNLEGIISKNIQCYFHKDKGTNYEYAHISFYEMESKITSEQATMSQIETGLSLDGILSGIPSSKYGHKYRTGYGVRYAKKNDLISLASRYNALMQVEATGNPYYAEMSISTQIDEKAEDKMDDIYACSNWVVFVDPKVDLDFFSEKEANSDLLIIHYSDQYTTSSGYDAITVTHKSQQYSMVIQEFLNTKGVTASTEDVHKIINLFNAVNGDWLLRLVSSKKAVKDSTFSREKISIVAAIKFMLAFLKHKDIVWVPISLEEMLRVSGGAGLSKDEGILSAKNLGFEKGPTSDDLLFVGLDRSATEPKVYLYPTEVKTGNNDNSVIKKAFQQASQTSDGLRKAFMPDGEINDSILYKVNRNFLMQMIVTSCKKMQVYHVDDSQEWDVILNDYREAILNEGCKLSLDVQEILGKGAVLSFRKALVSRRTSFKEGAINFIEMPEQDEFDLILKDVADIYNQIITRKDRELMLFSESNLEMIKGDLSKLKISELNSSDDIPGNEEGNVEKSEGVKEEQQKTEVNVQEKEQVTNSQKIEYEAETEEVRVGMRVLFGTNEQDGTPVYWEPNDTSQLFHTNTGIIGTMGTGKTQFTKSLITQLYNEQSHNVAGQELGILIFDYKGDYNNSKADFVEATNATIYQPYHLPFNPLALTQTAVFKPLLPIHTANAFKATIAKVYGLGPKQQDTLSQCIIETYANCGISPSDPSTWSNEAPTFEQVYQRYANDEEIKKNDSLAAAMNKLHQFQVFEGVPSNTKTLFDVLKGVVVIDLSGYDPDIQSLIVAITLDLFYVQMQAVGSSKMEGNYRQLTKLILVDEADNFMSEGFPALKKILKEGREFGVGTFLSTQFLNHFGSGEDDYSKYILTWVVHNVSDLKGSDVDFVFKTENKSTESISLFNAIKKLGKHHSIVKLGNSKPQYIVDKAFWELWNEMKNK